MQWRCGMRQFGSDRANALGRNEALCSPDVITKIADIKALLLTARRDPGTVIGELRNLAASASWQTREVAATALVEIGKRHPAILLATASRWARDPDANVRRAASEGLRGIVQRDPEGVRPMIKLRDSEAARLVQSVTPSA